MSRMIKNLMVVLLAALVFFSSALTSVRAEDVPEEPVEATTEEYLEQETTETLSEETQEPEEAVEQEVTENLLEEDQEAEEENLQQPEETGRVIKAAKEELADEELEEIGLIAEQDEEPGDDSVVLPMAEDDPVYPVPEHSKTLTDNGDGTYTLTLSVTGSGKSETKNPKTNVIFVMDRSGSMSNDNSYTGEAGYYVYTGTGTSNNYGYVNGNYVSLTRYNGNYWYQSGGQWQTYTGPIFRYSNNLRRDQVAIAAATNLVDSLLSHNTASVPDIVEISFVSFNDMATNGNGGNWTTSKTTAESVVAGYTGQNNTGTNWEDALIHAKDLADNKYAAQSDEPMYVIFLTDGNPTRYVNNNGGQAGNGQETAANIATCYDEASPRALALTNAGYNLYNIGVFGNVDRMEDLTDDANEATQPNHGTAKYYPASNASALQQAFDEILASITDSLSLADVKFTDGVTGMTSSTGVNGKPGNFVYKIAAPGEEPSVWADAPEATVDGNNVVTWDLSKDKNGNDLTIADGVTVTCSFIVWASQASQDLVADLNNGVLSYSELTADQKAQIIGTGAAHDQAPFKLKTNTDYPTLEYSILETTQQEGHDPVTVKIPQEPVAIENPDPVVLAEDKLNAVKKWDDSLDMGQREEIANVLLYLKVDGEYYYKHNGEPLGVTLTEASNWTESDYLSIAPGLLVTEDSPAYDPTKPHFTYDGVTYAMLETGHEYVFEESDINNHYELTAYTHHPMIMGVDEEGNQIVNDVIFTKDASGNITGIESVTTLGDNISATNTLKPGINVEKKTIDANGNPYDSNDTFEITVTLTDPEGNPLPLVTTVDDAGVSHTYAIDYRIYYGEKNPAYATSGDKHRSDHIYTTDSYVEETIYVGDVIRIVNVNSGTLFNVTEDLPTGSSYVLDNIEYTIGTGTDAAAAYTEDDIVTRDGVEWYPVKGNSASNAVVTNKLVHYFYIYHSAIAEDGNLEIIPMSDCDENGKYNLYAKTTEGTLYGGYYLNYEGKGTYADDGIKGTEGVAYTGMNYNNWASCEPQTEIGTSMTPVQDETYYIKEVPTYYLRNYHQINYVKTSGKLMALYLISAVDDLNYQETGLILKNDDKQESRVVSQMTFKNWATNKSVTLKANTVFKSLGITEAGEYLTYFDSTETDYFKTGTFTVLPYWKTPDGIEVTGISTRTITITSMTKSGISKTDD